MGAGYARRDPMINDEQAATKLARAILADITLYNRERYDSARDRFHELKDELAEGRELFRQRVAAMHYHVFDREARAWAKHDPRDEAVAEKPGPPAPKEERDGAKKRDEAETNKLIVMGVIIFVALMVAFGLAEYVGAKREEAKERGEPDKQKDTQHQSGATGAMPLVTVSSCTCFAKSSQKPTEVVLKEPPPDRSQPWSVELRNGFTTSHTFAFPDHAGAVVTPNMDALAAHLAMACDANIFVLVAGDTATAWSSTDATWRWNQKIPAQLADDPGERCTPLSIDRGVIMVPLASGTKATLSIR